MLKRSFVTYSVAALMSAGLSIQAGALGQDASRSAPAPDNTMVHFEGCAFPESALTATMPVVVGEGSTQAWVLTSVKLIAGSVSAEEAAKNTYTLEKGEPELLRTLNGKRVGVVGRVSSTPTRPKLDIVSIREISGGCPMMPSRP